MERMSARSGHIGFRTSPEEDLLIRKAAALHGWTVTQYVLCAVLDRAERDLYEQAARTDWETVYTASSAEPLTSIIEVFGEAGAG